MAQTTRFTSFGPVLLVVAPLKCIGSFRISSIPVRWLVDIINTNNIIKNSLMAQTTHFASFGPVVLVAAYPYPLHSLIASIIPIEMRYMISRYKKHE